MEPSTTEGLVRDREPTEPRITESAALAELLQGRSLYSETGSNPNFASYQPELLAVPEDISS